MRNICITLGCLLLAVTPIFGQGANSLAFDPVVAAEEEALRRSETALIMNMNLQRAVQEQDKKNFTGAALIYEEVIGLAGKLGNLKAVEEQLENARRAGL